MAEVDAVSDGAAIRVTGTPPETPPATPAPRPGEMSLVGHLTELRNRLVKSILAVVIGTAIGFLRWEAIRDFLLAPLPPNAEGVAQVQVLAPGDAFGIALRISLITGIILAMPVLLWQGWAFVSPGLTDSERRTARPWIPLALAFFALGVAVAYLVLPAAVGFLLSFTDDRMVANLAAGPYFDFVTTLFLAFGIVMEFPIVLFGLSRVGIVTSERLQRSRGIALVAIFAFAAIVTPGGDPISMLALGGTMFVLFEGTRYFVKRSGK